MDEELKQCHVSREDLRSGLADVKGYVDVTEEDLIQIYSAALRHARMRIQAGMIVSDHMTKDVVTVKKTTSLDEAARRLSGLKISGMPVVDENDKVLGVIGELDIISVLQGKKKRNYLKDILRRILREPVSARNEGGDVAGHMSSPAITISASEDVRDAAQIMNERRIKRLPVVDKDGKLLGIISRADIVRAMGKSGKF